MSMKITFNEITTKNSNKSTSCQTVLRYKLNFPKLTQNIEFSDVREKGLAAKKNYFSIREMIKDDKLVKQKSQRLTT